MIYAGMAYNLLLVIVFAWAIFEKGASPWWFLFMLILGVRLQVRGKNDPQQ